jgi:hypothetical protein
LITGNFAGAGLPDGIFSYQKSNFGNFLDGNEMENVGIFYRLSVIVWSFGILYPVLVYICTYCIKKNLATLMWLLRFYYHINIWNIMTMLSIVPTEWLEKMLKVILA